MSANAVGTASSTPGKPMPNQFTFSDEHDTTQITYYPIAPGPLRAGQTPGGASLEYQEGEGTIRQFLGDEIQIEESSIGHLISVTLQPNADAGAVIFTVMLPGVILPQGSDSESFKAIGIKTKTRGFALPHGADRTYTILHLRGHAKAVELPV